MLTTIMNTEKLVEYVERFCDLVEGLDNEFVNEFRFFDQQVSIPATVAALRVFYYIENKYVLRSERKLWYEILYFVLTDEKSKWDSLTAKEKINLCMAVGISKLFVMY